MTLNDILIRVKAGWPWTEANYPGYGALPDGRARDLFQLKHVLLHLMKQAGAIAAAIEHAEHRAADEADAAIRVRVETCGKLLTVALQLADLSGVHPEELETWVSKRYPWPEDADDEIS